jgi:hypothetical protein
MITFWHLLDCVGIYRASQNVTLGSGTRLILTCDSPGASLLVLSYNVSLQTVELRRMRMGGDVLEPLHSFSEVTPSPALLSAGTFALSSWLLTVLNHIYFSRTMEQ